MYCINCGTQLPDNANFCSNCGKQLKAGGNAWGTPYGGAPAYPAAQPILAEGKVFYDVILFDAGPKKIDVIRVIRQLTKLGLKEAKDISETFEGVVLKGVLRQTAEQAKMELEKVGATVSVR